MSVLRDPERCCVMSGSPVDKHSPLSIRDGQCPHVHTKALLDIHEDGSVHKKLVCDYHADSWIKWSDKASIATTVDEVLQAIESIKQVARAGDT